ncbi:hypothetical protein COV81_04580 [Candidatus Peregrinibacteria bacterium CG11_big_fil_rev_8_21_14_0_20_41_10]|nr:MAG: hypothetical protein COV81_04580 [Candidatus Peregrinibacteria bacterium CG11_big_fil_rev_8_21_14_0_20_41_10]PIZ73671.1 MAG: hypothetical protein COY06_05060 [Candidatus Peregrinibacteria bacterium CG_4_10_14_0_2_um_filter_41_8]PJC37710.1 MAG: hypothetical protein CO045_04005 [Candidatus Peregrinibacteria bacterium CG_4_9_14_0_2_um_filter_41_14]
MATVSFKASPELKTKLESVAQIKGINLSAYIKLILTAALKDELIKVTENGLTVAEELEILASTMDDETTGPFTDTNELLKSLRQ